MEELTGFPSIDKPWMKYYSSKRETFSHETMYECLVNSNDGNMDAYAIRYFGRFFTYRKTVENIDRIARGLFEHGIRKGDRVIVLGLNSPEILFSIYALNKLGAIACIEYVTQDDNKLIEIINEYEAKHIIVQDMFFDKFIDAFNECGITSIFLTRTFTSMPKLMRLISKGKFRTKSTTENVIEIADFVKKEIKSVQTAKGNGSDVAVIISSSGTTGIPKRVQLTNDALNALAYQGHYVDVSMTKGKSMLSPAPPFIAFGISLTLHMPLCNGVCVILCISPEPEFVVKQFIKYKPNLFMGGRVFGDKIMESAKVQRMNLSFINSFEMGGEKVDPEFIDELDKFFRERGYNGNIFTGYGMTETAACSTTETKGIKRRDSVGIPLCDVSFKVVDTETGDELPYNQEGELLINSPCMMEGYYNNLDETRKAIEVDNLGNKWIHTGDIGKVDEDGFVYVVGRIKRIAVTIDPTTGVQLKLFPDYIEYILRKSEFVKHCAVITKEHSVRKNIAVAFVLLGDKESSIESVKEYMENNVEEYCQPQEYVLVDDIPLRPNGKTDYQKLVELCVK